MVRWDENGTYRTVYGDLKFKRWVRFQDENDDTQFGGIHLLRSTNRVLCVQLAKEIGSTVEQNENWVGVSKVFEITETVVYVELGKDDKRDVYVFEMDERID